jgi:ribosomal protein S12 methylthiotransferase
MPLAAQRRVASDPRSLDGSRFILDLATRKMTEALPILQDQLTYHQQPVAAGTKGSYAFVSLGCPKNLVDSERMLGLLQLDGYRLVDDPDGADFVIVNTCGFIERARAESFASIDEMLELKRQGRTRGVIVSGCLAERQKEQLLDDRPEIDSLVGVFGREEITRVADRLVGDLHDQRTVFQPAPIRPLDDGNRLRITPRHFAYLKISEGCDRLCTFCAIPKMRGKHATKPIAEVLREARQLAADGVRELIVVAQDTTYYGMDLYGAPRLAELLTELEKIDELVWIRLMYFYPMYIDDRLIDVLAGSKKILPYLDMPLQHINDVMLRRMARRVTRAETEALLAKLRERIEHLTLRTTLITGFPGETDEQFEELAAFVREQRFERLGVFTYSLEPDTPAALLPGPVPEDVMAQRRDRLMAIQQEIAFARNEEQLGQRIEVIVDRPVPDEDNVWIGRSPADAPDVDALVYVTGNKRRLKPGSIVVCEVVGYRDYDLIAVAVGKPR